jgi:3-hydroxybutyryl-CoA dehydratase
MCPIPVSCGDRADSSRVFDEATVNKFAEISGDINPVHLDNNYASKTVFGARIVHGMLVTSLISALLANKLPGPGTIYLGQTIRFLRPVFIGDRITAEVVVTSVEEYPKIELDTRCYNEDGKNVITGTALVRIAGEK